MKNQHRSKQRRTVVLLLPELLELGLNQWTLNKLKITQGTIVSQFQTTVDPEDIDWLCPYSSKEYRRLAIDHLLGRFIEVIIMEGPDIVRRVRQIVGKQHDPNDWPPNTIRGELRDQHGVVHRETTHGKKYIWPYVMCPQSNTAAKRLLKRLKILHG
jgi:nucleoside diphosphate kinase